MNNTIFFRGVFIAITAAFFLSGYLLENLGISYVGEGGSPIHKIHLYSYIIIFLFSLLFIKFNPKFIILSMGPFFKVWLISLVFLLFVIFFGIAKFGTSGMAYIVNTFLSPILLLPIIFVISSEQKKRLIKYIAYLILLNCIVSIVEYALNIRLVDVEFSSFAFFRSSAFLTHPLNNALISIALLPYLMNKTFLPSILYFGLSVLALFAFGGRAALGVYLLIMFTISLPATYKFITKGVSMNKLTFSLLCLFSYFLFIAFVITVLETGIADRIISKLHMDGSASARVDVFYLLEQMSLNEWLFGATENLRSAIEVHLGISVIENYIIGWIFTFGLIGATPLMISFVYPLFFFFKEGNWTTKVSIIGFFIVAASNNSLTTKTPILLFLYTILLLLYLLEKEKVIDSRNTY